MRRDDPRVRSVMVTRLPEGLSPILDDVVTEEPLEIRISGETLAITMRTPGNDRELVLGFLLAEGVITAASDVSSIVHCAPRGQTSADETDNTVDVTLAPGVKPPIDADTGMLARRGTITTSACGVCGRRSIDDLLLRIKPLEHYDSIAPNIIRAAVRDLKEHQPLFERTGGCHAASLVSFEGDPVATFEDVGRHNAVDKVIGSRLLAGEGGASPIGSRRALVVSGRSSFEIVQKAFSAGVSVIASVSAPSSLAVALAERSNITLCGFVRDGAMTVYAHPARII